MADTWEQMRMTLAAAAEATFTVMDVPMTHFRQCAVTMDKWKALLISHYLIILGLVFNTRKMTVGVISVKNLYLLCRCDVSIQCL